MVARWWQFRAAPHFAVFPNIGTLGHSSFYLLLISHWSFLTFKIAFVGISKKWNPEEGTSPKTRWILIVPLVAPAQIQRCLVKFSILIVGKCRSATKTLELLWSGSWIEFKMSLVNNNEILCRCCAKKRLRESSTRRCTPPYQVGLHK
jgi:hypothetical protein